MGKPWDCPTCGKCFTTDRGAAQHIQDVHGTDVPPRKRPKLPPRDREMSLADISIEAQLKRAMGEPLDELEASLVFDDG